MNIAKPVGHQLDSVSFGFYSPEEIRSISVKSISNPTIFDQYNIPKRGGLYDPALGPLSNGQQCETCSLGYIHCPGHFGHIELPLPVYNPILFTHLTKYLRSTCLYCFRLRLPAVTLHLYKAKLLILSQGLLLEAIQLESAISLLPNTVMHQNVMEHNNDTDEAIEDNRMEIELDEDADKQSNTAEKSVRQMERISLYVQQVLERAANTTSCDPRHANSTAVSNYRRQLHREILLKLVSVPRCSHCLAPPLKIRTESSTKIFITKPTASNQAKLDKLQLSFSEAKLQAEYKAMLNQRNSALGTQSCDSTPEIEQVPESNKKPHSPGIVNGTSSYANSDESDSDSDTNLNGTLSDHIELPISNASIADYDSSKKFVNPDKYLTPSIASKIMELVWWKDGHFLDFIFLSRLDNPLIDMPIDHVYVPKSSHSIFFIQVLAVLPTKFRPARMVNGACVDHPQNAYMSNILVSAEEVRESAKALAASGAANAPLNFNRTEVLGHLNKFWISIQENVNSLIDSTKAPRSLSGDNANPGIRQLLEKKEGLFRKNMMGKRVNYAARSVISPDPWIETNEIGIPPVFAQTLTYPEPVTPHNVMQLMENVINGPSQWPGATYIEQEDGQLQSLENLTLEQRGALAAQLLTPKTTIGSHLPSYISHTNKKVYRHLRNGDILLLNRQPTLHKPSIMAHKARILPGEKTLRMHYANCNTYNADFDGDEMNVHFPQNEVARAEAYLIANTDNQYLVPTDGSPLRGLIQDHVVMGVRLTARDTFLTREEYHQLLMGALTQETLCKGRVLQLPPAIVKPKPLWTGKQVISTLLMNMTRGLKPLTLKAKTRVAERYWGPLGNEESTVILCQGDLVTGVLDKSQFGASSFGLVHSVYEIYGATIAGQLLGALSRLFSTYVQMIGFTCRMDDLLLTPEGDKWRTDLINESQLFGHDVAMEYTKSRNQTQLRARMEEVLREDEKLAGLDASMKSKMNGLTSAIISKCLPDGLLRVFPHNGMQLMTVSGAKGSNVNVSQISCCLGQQELEGRRVPIMISGKSLPSFTAFDTSARSGGFISGRFLTGIKPQEYFFHCMAGREGLIDTAVKTSRSGYLQRCLMKHLEGFRVHYDGTVRDSDGSILQFYYGEDGLDVTKQKHLRSFEFCADNSAALFAMYKGKELFGQVDEEKALKYVKSIRKKKLDDTVMAQLSPYQYLGATSDSFTNAMNEYVETDPHHVLRDKKRKGRKFNESIERKAFQILMRLKYMKSLVDPGEAVGVLAAQSIGEPSTQMTLNTFHFAGFGAKNVTLGIPRLREIIMTASTDIKTPAMTIVMHGNVTDTEQQAFCKEVSRLTLAAITKGVDVCEKVVTNVGRGASIQRQYLIKLEFFQAKDYKHVHHLQMEEVKYAAQSGFIKRLVTLIKREMNQLGKKKMNETLEALDAEDLIQVRSRRTDTNASNSEESISAHAKAGDDVDNEGEVGEGDATSSKYATQQKDNKSYEEDEDDVEIRKMTNNESDNEGDHMDAGSNMMEAVHNGMLDAEEKEELMLAHNETSWVTGMKFDKVKGASFELELTLPGESQKLFMVSLVEKAVHKTILHEIVGIERAYPVQNDVPSDPTMRMGTDGVNLQAMWQYEQLIDVNQLYTNDIGQLLKTYGVECARAAIIREIGGVFDVYGISVDKRHLTVIADYMTYEGGYKPFSRIGMGSNPSPFLQMSFETTCQFLNAACLTGDVDSLVSPSARIVVGQVVEAGTGSFDVLQPI